MKIMRTPKPERLQLGKVYLNVFDGRLYRVGLLNECRARLDPIFRTRRTITDRLHDKTVTIQAMPPSLNVSPNTMFPPVIVR